LRGGARGKNEDFDSSFGDYPRDNKYLHRDEE
jgi:hypothetical protein